MMPRKVRIIIGEYLAKLCGSILESAFNCMGRKVVAVQPDRLVSEKGLPLLITYVAFESFLMKDETIIIYCRFVDLAKAFVCGGHAWVM